MEDLIAIGKIRTSHGLKGFFKVLSYSGEWDHFYNLETINLRFRTLTAEMRVEAVNPFGKDEILMKLEGLNTPEEVKAYAGWEILVEGKDSAPLRDNEVYVRDLIGCSVLVGASVAGVVKSVITNTYREMLEVEKEDGSLKLVPFHDEYIGRVDLDEKFIEITAEWILE